MAWDICRVCLKGGDLVSLFDCDENNELLGEKYTHCCSIKVSENDQFPSLICLHCADKLMIAYQFKRQCIESYDTLSECLVEFKQSSGGNAPQSKAGTETVRIKRENGSYLQYDVPVTQENTEWPRKAGFSLAQQQLGRMQRQEIPQKRGRGRPRKYPNEQGQMAISPYQRRKISEGNNSSKETSLVSMLRNEESMKAELDDDTEKELLNPEVLLDEEAPNRDGDPDYIPEGEDDEIELSDDVESDGMMELSPRTGLLVHVGKRAGQPIKRGRGRPRKMQLKRGDSEDQDDDILLKETIMANSEPISDVLLNPQAREKKKYSKKKYFYDKIHTCDQCGASFRSNASLQAHIRRHLGIKPFVCNICGYSCVLNMELRRHMLRHSGLRPYQCRICDRRFGDFGSRQKHERLHLGERPYQCLLCGKSFTYSYVLSNHMLTHTGEKKFACEPCNKRFTKAHHLKYHNKVHHKELYMKQEMELQHKRKYQLVKNPQQQRILSMVTADGQTVQLIQQTEEGEEGEEGDEAHQVLEIQDEEGNSQEAHIIYQTSEDMEGEAPEEAEGEEEGERLEGEGAEEKSRVLATVEALEERGFCQDAQTGADAQDAPDEQEKDLYEADNIAIEGEVKMEQDIEEDEE